jgi:hypothetical protein
VNVRYGPPSHEQIQTTPLLAASVEWIVQIHGDTNIDVDAISHFLDLTSGELGTRSDEALVIGSPCRELNQTNGVRLDQILSWTPLIVNRAASLVLQRNSSMDKLLTMNASAVISDQRNIKSPF